MALDRQFDLEDLKGAHLTCWLRDEPRLKVGVLITLKETGDRTWMIRARHRVTVDDAKLQRHWRVGRVGGLR